MKANPCRAFVLLLWAVVTIPSSAVGVAAGVPFGPPPGTPPDSSRRRPVLLVPGWAGTLEEMRPLQERFVRDGWDPSQVLALEFDDPVGSNVDHAAELEVALHELLLRADAQEVDVVAHSMGGLALWVLLDVKRDAIPVRRVVFLASPLRGTFTAHLGWGEGGEEMRPGSPLLQELQAGPPPQRWVEALTIRTPLDLNVLPVSRAALSGIPDRMVCCPLHQGLLDHEETYRVVRDFLLGREGAW